jgi:oligopeptide transport system permease protein
MDGWIRAGVVVERGRWRNGWRRMRRNRMAMLSVAMIGVLALAAQFGPALSPYAPDALDWSALASPPALGGPHWLGTDHLGRDLMVRTLHGMRISLLIALMATAISVSIGVAWGATAGYVGGRVDAVMMRVVDVLYSLPYIFFVIVLTVLFGRDLVLLFVAIGAVGWLTMARIVRGQALALRHREFIEAAIATGASTPRILLRHIAPNVAGPVVVYASLIVPQMILFESFLSFLGLGVQEPLASLGSLVAEGAAGMESAPWMLIVPATALVTLLMCSNFLGDGLRDAFDPTDSR